MARQHN